MYLDEVDAEIQCGACDDWFDVNCGFWAQLWECPYCGAHGARKEADQD